MTTAFNGSQLSGKYDLYTASVIAIRRRGTSAGDFMGIEMRSHLVHPFAS